MLLKDIYDYVLFVRASGDESLGPQRCYSNEFAICFLRASSETFLGTQRYFIKQLAIHFCSRLRQGDFRSTAMLFKSISQ